MQHNKSESVRADSPSRLGSMLDDRFRPNGTRFFPLEDGTPTGLYEEYVQLERNKAPSRAEPPHQSRV